MDKGILLEYLNRKLGKVKSELEDDEFAGQYDRGVRDTLLDIIRDIEMEEWK